MNEENENSQPEDSMAYFGNSNELNIEAPHTMDDINMEAYLNGYAQSSSKEIAPPDPLEFRNGLYIPPEETRHNQLSVEEVMGWTLSDDQNDSEDDLDDNEFDMDFDDVEFPPPLKSDSVNPVMCQRHLNQPNFNDMQYSPYVPPWSYTNTYPEDFAKNPEMYGKEDFPPFQFINPSNLQLHNNNYDYAMLQKQSNTNTEDIPISMDDLDMDIDLAVPVDLDVDDMYPILDEPKPSVANAPIASSSSNIEQHPTESSNITAISRAKENIHSAPETIIHSTDSIDDNIESGHPCSNSNTALREFENSYDDGDRQPKDLHLQASVMTTPPPEQAFIKPEKQQHELTSSINSSPNASIQTEPRRKKTRRRTARSSASSSGSTHFCNMMFADGSECHRSFTRPYDLARHQETIHAPVRKMYHCEYCGDDSKTFSRLDALSRHKRLKHSG